MNVTWAMWLAARDREALGRVRLVPGVQVLPVTDGIWLAGTRLSEADERVVRALPTTRRYTVNDSRHLIPTGHRLPACALPEGDWLPIKQWIQPDFGMPLRGATPARFAEIWLATEERPRPVNLLVTTPETWVNWCRQAPAIRLDRLHYARSEDDRIAVCGEPLPPIPGQAFVLVDGIAIAAGYRVEPAIDPVTLAGVLGLESGDTALVHGGGRIEIVQACEWFAATRGATWGLVG